MIRWHIYCFLFSFGTHWYAYAVAESKVVETCDLLIKYIDEFYGIGIYAGKDFVTGIDPIQTCIGIPVPLRTVYKSELINYLEWYNETHGLAVLGVGMLYNHIKSNNHVLVRKFPLSDVSNGIYQFRNPAYISEASSDLCYESNGYIEIGEQIFSNYGSDWFEYRQQTELEPSKSDNKNDIFYQPNIYTSRSSSSHISRSNLGRTSTVLPGCSTKYTFYDKDKQRLIAMNNIPKGTIIEVSRALLLPELPFTAYGALTEFLWWKPRDKSDISIDDSGEIDSQSWKGSYDIEYEDDTSYVVLLTGSGALYHSKQVDPDHSSCGNSCVGPDVNVLYDWWSLDAHLTSSASDDTRSDCTNKSNQNKDSNHNSTHKHDESTGSEDYTFRKTNYGDPCSTQMFVSFTAGRDIIKGEKLIVDLKNDIDRPWVRYSKVSFARQCL